MGVIALLTDFGTRDHYLAQMKGVILSHCTDATILDIAHEVERFNVRAGSFILAAAARYTPKGTIHVAVVDPGVGSGRRPIVFQCLDALFVGPDNGLMVLAAELRGLQAAYTIDVERLGLTRISNVFHGRDIFAPVACKLYNGLAPDQVGEKIDDYVRSSFTIARARGRSILAEVVYVDGFGNVITNVPTEVVMGVGSRLRAKVKGKLISLPLVRTYSDVGCGHYAALKGSHGFLEIGMNQANASNRLGLKAGDKIEFRKE